MTCAANSELPNEDDVYEILQAVSGAITCTIGLQRLAREINLQPADLEPLIAVLLPVRDRLQPVVQALTEAGSL